LKKVAYRKFPIFFTPFQASSTKICLHVKFIVVVVCGTVVAIGDDYSGKNTNNNKFVKYMLLLVLVMLMLL